MARSSTARGHLESARQDLHQLPADLQPAARPSELHPLAPWHVIWLVVGGEFQARGRPCSGRGKPHGPWLWKAYFRAFAGRSRAPPRRNSGPFGSARARQATSGISRGANGGFSFPRTPARLRKGARALSLRCARLFANFSRVGGIFCPGGAALQRARGVVVSQHAGGPGLNPQRVHASAAKSKFKAA